MMIDVFFDKVESYDRLLVKSCLDQFILCDFSGEQLHSMKVLVKPNLISARKAPLSCTNPGFLLALVEWLSDQGAKVWVGDSPAYGTGASALHHLGLLEEFERRGVKVADFNRSREVLLRCGKKVNVAIDALECDLFVNVPKLKAHGQMYVTLAVKNVFGIIKGMDKSMIHMVEGGAGGRFCEIIIDLAEILPQNIHVLDGVVAMHKEGPISGEPLRLGCMGYSKNQFALDASVITLLKLSHSKSPLWVEAHKRGYVDRGQQVIHYPWLKPDNFSDKTFLAPQDLSPIRFNPFRFIHGNIKRIVQKMSV